MEWKPIRPISGNTETDKVPDTKVALGSSNSSRPPLEPIRLGTGKKSFKEKRQEMMPLTTEITAKLKKDPLTLRADTLQGFKDSWQALVQPVKNQAQNIKGFDAQAPLPEAIAQEFKTVVGAVELAFAPISAVFSAAENVPILGTITKILEFPGMVATDAVDQTAVRGVDKLIDNTDLSPDVKESLKESSKSILELSAQILAGKVGIEKMGTLNKKFGPIDAKTIWDRSFEVAKKRLGMMPDEEPVRTKVPEKTSQETTPTKDVTFREDIKTNIDPTTGKVITPERKTTTTEKFTKDEIAILKKQGFDDNMIKKLEQNKLAQEQKPTETVETKMVEKAPAETKVEQKPLQPTGTGKVKESAASKKLLKEGDEALKYQAGEESVQRKIAQDVISSDYESAKKIISGESPLPDGVRAGFMLSEMEKSALARNDYDTIKSLSQSPLTLEGTAAGQIVQSFSALDPESAVSAIADIEKSRKNIDTKQGVLEKKITKKGLEKFITDLEC